MAGTRIAATAVVTAVLASAATLAGAAPTVAPEARPGLCGSAGTDVPASFGAFSDHVGVVDLQWFYGFGAPVTFFECVEGHPRRLGTVTTPADTPVTELPAAVPWSCDRLVRRFAAVSTPPGGGPLRGIASVRTVSCARRLSLRAPAEVAVGGAARVTVVDAWGVGGITPRLCVTSPGGRRRCGSVRLRPSVTRASRSFRAVTRGVWRLDLQVRGFHVRRLLAVGTAPVARTVRPVLLATGDSTMQGVAGSLSDALPAYDVPNEVYLGREITNGGWPGLARQQVRRYHPAITVVSIGGVEAFPLPAADGTLHDCCDAEWSAEYARRVRRVMTTYRQGRRGRVFYLTVVLPKNPARAALTRAANASMVRAGAGLSGVTVLRMDLLFTPHGYQPTLRDHGRDVHVRESDGVHLSASGTSIEAREVAKAIRGQPTLVPPGPDLPPAAAGG